MRPRRRRAAVASLVASAVAGSLVAAPVAANAQTSGDGSQPPGSTTLTATEATPGYAPPFTGNGEIGIRVPRAGQGGSTGAVPVEAQLAGFYAQPAGGVQQRATIPTWTPLTVSDGGQTLAPGVGRWSDWRQTLDLMTGVVTTSLRWTAPDEHTSTVTYQVFCDRDRPDVGVVRLTVVPHWTGTLSVTDAVDGGDATLSTQSARGWDADTRTDWVAIDAVGTGLAAALASSLQTTADVVGSVSPADQHVDQSVGQSIRLAVRAGTSVTVTKYVGIVTSSGVVPPVAVARAQAAAAEHAGFDSLLRENDAAWASLWVGRIDVLGDPKMATEVDASEFALWASTRAGLDWSLSPGGLSSAGYNGHVFWDADTWMYPALLAQHPDLAVGVDAYREARLGAAEAHASATGYLGARFPWESALDGTEQIPPPASLFSEGLYEQHITADVALAQWQYYEATGNRQWLATRGWPVIAAAAAFWASRATPGVDRSQHVDGVTGPDEENADVDDEVYTNAAAATVLRDATDAAHVLGVPAPATWDQIADHLVVPVDAGLGITPEFAGYDGQMVKQADATLLEYPLAFDIPRNVAQSDLDYYVPRTDPSGPSMSDAIASIDSAELESAGCSSFVFTERSVDPFVHDPFDQLSETRSGGVLTFMTGIGGFLQEFLYGYSGLRWSTQAVDLAPVLTRPLTGIVLHDLAWHGRRFTVSIGPRHTVVSDLGGGVLPVRVGSRTRTLRAGASLTVDTDRPDLAPSPDDAMCGAATATSSQPGTPPLAAVDGSTATDWQPSKVPATLTVVLRAPERIDTATVTWGRSWPRPPALNLPPPPGPVTTLRPGSYTVSVSANGRQWRTLAEESGQTTATTDTFHFAPVEAKEVRISIGGASPNGLPALDELVVSG